MKTLVFLRTIEQFERFNQYKGTLNKEIPKEIIALEVKLRFFLKKNGIAYKIQETYIADDLAKRMDDAAYYIGDNWHKDLFKFKGISLGEIFQSNIKFYLSRIIKYLKTLENVVKVENPSKIIIFEETDYFPKEFFEIVKKFCLLKKIPLIIFNRDNSEKIIKKKESISLKKLIEKYFINYLNQFFYILLHFFSSNLRCLKNSKILKKGKKKKIYFVLSGFSLNYLIKELLEDYEVVMLQAHVYLPFIKSNFKNLVLRKNSIFYRFINDYYNKKTMTESNNFFNNSLNKWKNIIKSQEFRKIFWFEDISLWPFVKEMIIHFIFNRFREKIELILATTKLIRKEKPDLLIFFADVTEYTMPYALTAFKFNVHSLIIQHGVIGTKCGFVPSYSEKFAAWGDISRKLLIEFGLHPDKIVITGAARFDRYFEYNNKIIKNRIKELVYKDFKIESGKKLIVLTLNHKDFYIGFNSSFENQNDVERNLYCIINTIKSLYDVNLIVKLHPHDLYPFFTEEIIKELKAKNVSVTENYNIEKLLTASDLVITSGSGTGLEAMLVEKPVIQIAFKKLTHSFDYYDDSVIKVKECKKLHSAIQKILDNPNLLKNNQKKFIKDYLFEFDGRSLERLIQLIHHMVHK